MLVTKLAACCKTGNHPQFNDTFPLISMPFGSGPRNAWYVDYYFFILPWTVKTIMFCECFTEERGIIK